MSKRSIVLIIVAIVLAGGVLAYALTRKGNTQKNSSPTAPQSGSSAQSLSGTITPTVGTGKKQAATGASQSAPSSRNQDQPPLLLKSIGVDLDYYDSATNKAGDFVFTKEKLQFNRLFMGYGFVIPAEIAQGGNAKSNPQPTFILPLGTKVLALVDGVVADVPTLYSNDFSVMVTDSANSQWRYETEHVINPLVKKGDTVKAGQVVAEVSNYDNGSPAGYGIVEIGILKGGNPPQHICPFAYLDPSIKDDVLKKLTALFTAWEGYIGDPSLYDESNATPGCLATDPING